MSEETPVTAVDPPYEATPREDAVGSRPVAAKPRRFLLLLLALAAVAVVAVAGALLRVNDTHAPQYSLEQMAKAAQNKDWDGVQKYIDVDAVASTFVDAALSKAFGVDTSGTAGPGVGMKPAAVQMIEDSLKNSVVNPSGASIGRLSGVLFMEKAKSVTSVGENEALVTVEIPVSASETRDVVLRMARADDHWRITAFENAAELPDLSF